MPQPQDNFWSTILWFFLIPAGVGIGASLVANFLYPILISSLESRKFISNQKRKLPQNWIASSSACTTARRIKSNILFDGILWLLYWRPARSQLLWVPSLLSAFYRCNFLLRSKVSQSALSALILLELSFVHLPSVCLDL